MYCLFILGMAIAKSWIDYGEHVYIKLKWRSLQWTEDGYRKNHWNTYSITTDNKYY